MFNIVNVIVMIIAGFLMSVLYALSVSPQKMESVWGEKAYKICGRLRALSMVFMAIVIAAYVVYTFYPLDIGVANRFPWPYWVSLVIALILMIPSAYLMIKGVKDAGMEAVRPDKSSQMYGGIYERIRHPQAFGEIITWFAIAIACHSLHLTLFSIIWIPVWIWWCKVEEKDLILRYGNDYIEYMKRSGLFFPKKKQS
jgi:protein-S-isoprenylcysteine O-methyltransferase Ste14